MRKQQNNNLVESWLHQSYFQDISVMGQKTRSAKAQIGSPRVMLNARKLNRWSLLRDTEVEHKTGVETFQQIKKCGNLHRTLFYFLLSISIFYQSIFFLHCWLGLNYYIKVQPRLSSSMKWNKKFSLLLIFIIILTRKLCCKILC